MKYQTNPASLRRHGTRCAGEVAAVANNRLCGLGVAYNARIGGFLSPPKMNITFLSYISESHRARDG